MKGSCTPPNILTHSTFVKGEPSGNYGGYKALIGGSLKLLRRMTYGCYKAAGGVINTSTSTPIIKMVIDKPLQDIVMKQGYDMGSIDRETSYVDVSDNYRWKYKQLLRMDGVKTITYRDTEGKNQLPIVFDFEKSQVRIINIGESGYIFDKIFYETSQGDLRSTTTNRRFQSTNSDLVQLAWTNPSYLIRDAVIKGYDQNGLILEDPDVLTAYNSITLYIINSQHAFLMSQPFWRGFFRSSKMIKADWDNLATKNASVYAEMIRYKQSIPNMWHKLQVGKGKSVSMWNKSVYISATRYFVKYEVLSVNTQDTIFFTKTARPINSYDGKIDYNLETNNVRGLSPALLNDTVVRKTKKIPLTKDVLLLYNEYVNRIYYTPSNIVTPLLGTVVVERKLPVNSSDTYVYRNITKNTVRGIIADNILTQELEILMSDLDGRLLESVLDNSNKRRPIKDILLDLRTAPKYVLIRI